MSETEYNFLHGRYDYKRDEVFSYCRNYGWCSGYDGEGKPVITNSGVKAIKAYNKNRIDVI